MILGHCPLVVDDTRLILGADSVVAINNLPHFGVLTQGSSLSGQQYSHTLQHGLGRWGVYSGHCACSAVCWYLYGVCPILSPPSNSSPAWHFMISCARLQKNRQTSATSYTGKTALAAGWDISTHSLMWALMCPLFSNTTWFGFKYLSSAKQTWRS